MDPVGLVSDEQRSVMSDFLARDLEEIEEKLPPDASGMSTHFCLPSYDPTAPTLDGACVETYC